MTLSPVWCATCPHTTQRVTLNAAAPPRERWTVGGDRCTHFVMHTHAYMHTHTHTHTLTNACHISCLWSMYSDMQYFCLWRPAATYVCTHNFLYTNIRNQRKENFRDIVEAHCYMQATTCQLASAR